ncbi:VanW family protein [Mesobacillus subterraneus]|uniref:VanW family protein n=1 Tax=Mesobacillus subterraneus TaxID=285983 RepID=UPI00203D034E|nr:VanW family protein [Mesobacillus subterraneus]
MNSRQIVKVSLIIIVFSLFTYSFTYFGASAISSPKNVESLYSDQTFIGPINVSNKSKDEARVLLEEKWAEWVSSAKVALIYKEHSYPVTAENLTLLIDQSVSSASSGQKNGLFIQLEYLNGVLPDAIIKQLNQEMLENDLTEAIQSFKEHIVIDLAGYLPKEEPIEVSSASYLLKDKNEEVSAFIDSFPAIELEAESLFSLAAFVAESEMPQLSDHTYSQIATAIYQAVLPTNFLISERHISRQLPDRIDPGFEAKVQFEKKMDFSIYNPNASTYTIEFDWKSPNLEVSVKGAPFLYTYSIHTLDKQEFQPRMIKQFSPLLSAGQKSVKVEGSPGLVVKVVRETHSKEGELMKTEVLSEDFYPPVHRIEVHPLGTAVVETESGTADGGDSAVLPVDGGSDTQQDQSAGETQPVEDEKDDEEADADNDGLFGNPNEEPK